MKYETSKSEAELSELDILKWYSQEEIVESFCGLISMGTIHSPLREDNNPSANYYYNEEGKLHLRDWSPQYYFHGDWVGIAGYFYGISSDGRLTFHQRNKTLTLLYREFILDNKQDRTKRKPRTQYYKNNEKQRSKAKISCIKRNWTYEDYYFWYPIPIEVLEYYDVHPVEKVFFNGVENHNLRSKYGDPTYGYAIVVNGTTYWKVYKPFSKKYKWRNNYPKGAINGKDLEGDKILCTSLKDAMVTRMITGIPTYCYQGESHIPKMLIPGTRLLVRDNDEAGLAYAEAMQDKHKLPYFTFTGAKDVFDLTKNQCIISTRNQWLNYALEQV